MAEKKDEKDVKKAPAKKPAAKKSESKNATPKKTAAKKETATKKAAPAKASKKPAEKKKPSGKLVRITQIGSPIGRQSYQRKTLIGLGLNKLNRTRELEDTPAVRGMINKVSHLVKIEDAA